MSITIAYTGGTEILATDYLTQWATGQTVTVTGLTFSGNLYARCEIAKKSKEAMTTRCSGTSGGTVTCYIPDHVMAMSGTLVMNLTAIDSDRATVVVTIKIPVRAAAMPTDWDPDPGKVITIDSLISQIDAAVADVNAAASKVNAAVASIPSDWQEAVSAMMKAGSNTDDDYLKYGDDLNSISKACTRMSTGSSVTGGISNVPDGVTDQFVVYTIAADQDPYRLAQVLYTIDKTGVRTFTRTGAGSSWTGWECMENDVDTLEDSATKTRAIDVKLALSGIVDDLPSSSEVYMSGKDAPQGAGVRYRSLAFDTTYVESIRLEFLTSAYISSVVWLDADGAALKRLDDYSEKSIQVTASRDDVHGCAKIVVSADCCKLEQGTVTVTAAAAWAAWAKLESDKRFSKSPVPTPVARGAINGVVGRYATTPRAVVFDVGGAVAIRVHAVTTKYWDGTTWIAEDGTIVDYSSAGTTFEFSDNVIWYLSVVSGARWLMLSCDDYKRFMEHDGEDSIVTLFYESSVDEVIYKDSAWRNKKIVWLGTSIPCAGGFTPGTPNYPALVGEYLGADVCNEAVGSSPMHCRVKSRVDESKNPYGFFYNWEGASRCLTNSEEEMQWLIDNFDSDIFTYGKVSSIDDALRSNILECGYERKIDKYLTDYNKPDLWVIDHGHNDGNLMLDDADWTDGYVAEGVKRSGYYQYGVFHDSSSASYLAFDVSTFDVAEVSGIKSAWMDTYVVVDASGTVLSQGGTSSDNSAGTIFRGICDVSSASEIRISFHNADAASEAAASVLNREYAVNKFTFKGATGFIIDRIKSFDPKARIVIIGEYENESRPQVVKYQNDVADTWSIPIMPSWSIYGWSQNAILTKGAWKDGYWFDDINDSASYKTELAVALSDGVHPHSDKSGNTLRFMAKHIARWLNGLSPIK